MTCARRPSTSSRGWVGWSRASPSIDLEFINEHHPKLDGLKRVEASLRIPRKTFFAHAEAPDVPTALDDVAEKLERQLRDHRGKKRSRLHRGLESAHLSPGATDDTE